MSGGDFSDFASTNGEAMRCGGEGDLRLNLFGETIPFDTSAYGSVEVFEVWRSRTLNQEH